LLLKKWQKRQVKVELMKEGRRGMGGRSNFDGTRRACQCHQPPASFLLFSVSLSFIQFFIYKLQFFHINFIIVFYFTLITISPFLTQHKLVPQINSQIPTRFQHNQK
jgi:hypothetical protein